jgi:hypothetical protein
VAKQGIEGTGSAAEVFGIVINAIIQYVKKARPALLYFQAAEPNRRALYARIIRRILPDLPGWSSTADDAGQFAIYNRRAIKSAMTEGELDRFKKYVRPVVKTTPKMEKTTNPSGRTTDHVEWKVTGDTGEIRRFKSKKEAQAYFDSCNQGVTEGVQPITELRERMFQFVKSVLPKWPDYVLKDWIYNLARGDHQAGAGGWEEDPEWGFNRRTILKVISDAGLTPDTQWQLVPDMKFTMGMFSPWTQQQLIGRAGGHSDLGMGIPRDKERHATQAALAQQQGGIRKEPVILIKTATGYNLPEGWHRTIQHFAKYPTGYTGPAWVAVAQGQQGVDEEVTRQMSQGGLRASYQSKYNQPMMEDYLDEARS